MKFYEVQQALEEGKKIRRKSNPNVIFHMGKISQFFTTDPMPSLIRVDNGDSSHSDLYGRRELFADDWEIIDDDQKE